MAEYEVQKFVSSKVINKEREMMREARERVLLKAERKAELKLSKEELARARGDDKWMLPDLEEKLKKKKKKKHKKRKGSDAEDDWVESTNNKPITEKDEPEQKRDDWMEMGMISTYTRRDGLSKSEKREKEKREKEAANAPGSSSRELNPYFAKGGSGIPNTSMKPSQPISTGDGGVTWLLKAYKRAEEQSKEENISLEEIASKRWGSLARFHEMLAIAKEKAANIKTANNEIRSKKKRRERSRSREIQSERRRSREKQMDRSRSREKRKNRSRSREERKNRSRSREEQKNRSRSREEQKNRSRSREKRKNRSRSREKRKNRSRSREELKDRSRSRESRKGRIRSREKKTDQSRISEKRKAGSKSKSPTFKFSKPVENFKKQSTTGNSTRYSSSVGWKTEKRKEEERSRFNAEKRKKSVEKEEELSNSDTDSEKIPQKLEETKNIFKIMTEAEMNSLAAKIVKAEIMGNASLTSELKTKLDSAREARLNFIASGGDPDEQDKPEKVTKIQYHDTKVKQKKTKVETHKDGQRIRYFGDDDRYDLQQMYEREKMNTAEDQNSMLSGIAGKALEKTNEEYDMDDMLVTTAARKKNEDQEEAKKQNRAAAQHLEMEKTLEDCKWCIGSKRSNKHLMVSMGKSVYLSVPGHTSMATGHCLIVPMGHVAAGTHLDEDVWEEIQDYRKALVKMFLSRDEDCVFIETAMGFKKHPHMVIECIPISDDLGSITPMYFQKAIQECENEWSDNKKLIKLKDNRIFRNVPKGLPYFHVDFGMDSGFAHIIEEEAEFSRRFGHEIVGGMMDIDTRTFRNPSWEGFDIQKRKVIEFSTMWKEFDWTRKLGEVRDSSSDSD